MSFKNDEPRTNVAYMLLKYGERGVFDDATVRRLWFSLYKDLADAAGIDFSEADSKSS